MLEQEHQRRAREALQHVRGLRHSGDTPAAVLFAEETLAHVSDGGQLPPETFAELYVELVAERSAALEEIAESLAHERPRRRPSRYLRLGPLRARAVRLLRRVGAG